MILHSTFTTTTWFLLVDRDNTLVLSFLSSNHSRTLVDFNDCMSKGELTTFITEQCNLMNELTHNVNNVVTYIEQIEQCPPSHRGDDEDADANVFDDEDADADGDVRNRRCYFNRRGMRDNNHSNTDLFAKIKFSLPPFASNVYPEAYLDWELAVQ